MLPKIGDDDLIALNGEVQAEVVVDRQVLGDDFLATQDVKFTHTAEALLIHCGL